MLEAWRRRRLAERARDGDGDAFAALLRPELHRLHQAAWYLARDADEAEDLAQEACVRAFQAISRFDPAAPLGPWLHRILRNVFLDRRKSAASRLEVRADDLDAEDAPTSADSSAEPEGPLDAILTAERRLQLAELVHELPAPFREVLVLSDIQGWNQAEVCAATGLPVGTVKSRLSRARLMLRRRLLEVREPSGVAGRIHTRKGGGAS